ncbi:MAG: type VI secretion system tip protein VgrG, partial [Deltaproteobacteria bacterium]|nr:type VI secretion system tip protein VgrG [Deltaproteobacteria bacterium]
WSAAPQAQRALERHVVESTPCQGVSNAIGFGAGMMFTLGENPSLALEQHRFLLVGVTHEGSYGDEGGYANRFECIPVVHEFRPALRTAKPRVHGLLSGVVVAPDENEGGFDALRRVRVKLHVDRHASETEYAYCWVRVVQSLAGNGYGAQVVPRPGMEVVVSFIDGDPDCPVVCGCVYNGVNLPHDESQLSYDVSSFRTASEDGNGFTELRIAEPPGREQLFVHAQRRMDLRVRGSLYETVCGNREEVIGGDTGGDHNVLVHNNYNHKVHGDCYTEIGMDKYETVYGLGRQSYESDLYTNVVGHHSLTASRIVYESSELLSQKAGTIRLTSSSHIDVKAGGKVVLESNNAIEIKVGESFISISPTQIAIQAPKIRINSGGYVGAAEEAESVPGFYQRYPIEALCADDGTMDLTSSGRGGTRRKNESGWLEPQSAPPLTPPPLAPRPSSGSATRSRDFLDLEWLEREAWCSERVTLVGHTRGFRCDERETVYIYGADDGTVVRTHTDGFSDPGFRKSVLLTDILPRRLGDTLESSRDLDALGLSARTPVSLKLNFGMSVATKRCSTNHARFDLTVQNGEAVISATISYVPGWLGHIIQLGSSVPPWTGGLIGKKVYGSYDWRFCKEIKPGYGWLFWDDLEWRPVPKSWEYAMRKRYGCALWREEGEVKVQYGSSAWPDPVSDWGEKEYKRARRIMKAWKMAIETQWSNRFDLKRRECQSSDPRCCRYSTRVEVNFVQARTRGDGIVVGANQGRSNVRCWSLGDGDPETLAAHEFGHLLGNPDEYEGAPHIDTTINDDGAVAGIDEESIMGSGTLVKRRHFRTICAHLSSMIEEQYHRTFKYEAVPVA